MRLQRLDNRLLWDDPSLIATISAAILYARCLEIRSEVSFSAASDRRSTRSFSDRSLSNSSLPSTYLFLGPHIFFMCATIFGLEENWSKKSGSGFLEASLSVVSKLVTVGSFFSS